jgi:selT/selW/selH-like putative selenoprotein
VKELALEPVLVEGRGGVFDVIVDGDVIFSKRSARRFPEPDEILDSIRARRPYSE